MKEQINLYQGDCIIQSNKIKDNSVDLILTDLPYGTIKDIGNSDTIKHGLKNKTLWDDTIDIDRFMIIANRVLRKNGKMILFAQQPFTTNLIKSTIPNLPFLYSMIWEKDHFANSLIAKKAPVSYYEDILVFSKKYDDDLSHPLRLYFKNVLEYINLPKKEIIKQIGQSVDHVFRINSTQFSLCTEKTYLSVVNTFKIDKMVFFKTYNKLLLIDEAFNSTFNLPPNKKIKSNIFKYKKDYEGLHPTQKPVALLEDLIYTFSNENNLVVDFTMGSGSTGVAAKNLNRKFIGIELDEKYFEIAKNRISK